MTHQPPETITSQEHLQDQLNALWDDLETHYAPSMTPEIDRLLRSLDARNLDGTLTQPQFNATVTKIMKDLRRSYAFTGAECQIDPAYWPVKDSTGKSNKQRAKSIHGKKNLSKKGKLHVVFVGTGEQRVVRQFRTAIDAHLYRDCLIESRKTLKAVIRNQARDPNRTDEQLRVLADAKFKAEHRKSALRKAMAPDPETGKVPSFAEVLRLPEFDRWSEPPKRRPTT